MTQIILLWLWSQTPQLGQADSIHGATHHFFDSDAYLYDIFWGDFFHLYHLAHPLVHAVFNIYQI